VERAVCSVEGGARDLGVPPPHRQCMWCLALATASCSGAIRRYRDEGVAELMLSFGFPVRTPALVARRQAASRGLLQPRVRTRPHLDNTWVPAGMNRPIYLRDFSILWSETNEWIHLTMTSLDSSSPRCGFPNDRRRWCVLLSLLSGGVRLA